MLHVRLFPPQVLSDLNFFNVKSEKELASRLRAVQRVTAAAIGAYFLVRYVPILADKLRSDFNAGAVVGLVLLVSQFYLSVHATRLITSGISGYISMMQAVSSIKNKEIGRTVIFLATVGIAYIYSQEYNGPFAGTGLNLLEKLFKKVEDKYTKPLYRYFYTQTS